MNVLSSVIIHIKRKKGMKWLPVVFVISRAQAVFAGGCAARYTPSSASLLEGTIWITIYISSYKTVFSKVRIMHKCVINTTFTFTSSSSQ